MTIRAGVRADTFPSVLWTRVACSMCEAPIWVPGPSPTPDDRPRCAHHIGHGGDGKLLLAIVK